VVVAVQQENVLGCRYTMSPHVSNYVCRWK